MSADEKESSTCEYLNKMYALLLKVKERDFFKGLGWKEREKIQKLIKDLNFLIQ